MALDLTHEGIAFPLARPAEVARSGLKRALDIIVAGGLLALFAPLFAFVALMIKIDSSGPVLFRQTRTGLGGRRFTILKFRSMTVMENGGQISQATKGDQRVTRVGRVLRALSIDELPQVVNILKGDMSLVGPRPHALSHDEMWAKSVAGYDARFRARPGLTGYAQVRGFRGEVLEPAEIQSRVDADNYYIDNWSLGFELKILLLTVPLMLHDPNAY